MKKTKLVKFGIPMLLILTSILAILIVAFAAQDKHYVVDVVKEEATSKDDNLQITEKIVKNSNTNDYDSKSLNYEVELKNIAQTNVETQIAMLVDSSYSMKENGTIDIAKSKSIEFANSINSGLKNYRMSVSTNENTKQNMVSNITTITNTINGINTTSNTNDSNNGLDNAYSTFTTPIKADQNVNKYIIVFTDSTDEVLEKMKTLTQNDQNLTIISVLIDMTSTSYEINGVANCGEVYFLSSNTEEEISSDVQNFDIGKTLNDINKSVKNIKLSNTYLDKIAEYFDITDISVTNGNIKKTNDGYVWDLDILNYDCSEKLTFKLSLKSNKDIDAGVIFNELYTNKTQEATYTTYNSDETKTLKGTDSRDGTDSTIIKICQGYDLKIKAVNESNTDLAVSGVEFKVEGTNEKGEKTCEITKKTDSNGYITITADDARALRADGKIEYRVTPTVNGLVGYVNTDAVTFAVINNKTTRKLEFDNYQSNLQSNIKEENRTVEVKVPINSQRIDFEVKAQELNNNNVLLSGCEFELIQPKLNNKYEMELLKGTSDANGTIHFNPTVMTLDGEYDYILRQTSAPNGYNITSLTLLKIKFENGVITNVSKQFNSDVDIEICDDTDNHVLVTVGNECIYTDPFNLQINLTDNQTGAKLDGATYLISTTDRYNTTRSEYVTTDSNGQINAKIYGTGNLSIQITEQSPKVGYTADIATKDLKINKNNGKVQIWNKTPSNLDANLDNNQENIIVNLTSQKRLEQNIVKVKLVDSSETDIPVGAGVVYTLYDTETGEKYGPIASDRNGELKFTVNNKQQGQHKYSLEVDYNTIPNEYNQGSVVSPIEINLVYDNVGYISDMNIVNDQTVIENGFSAINGNNTREYTAYLEIGYELEQSNTAEFRVKLSNKDNIAQAINGAAYNINIEWESNGVTKTKEIKERRTNSDGLISTRIVKAKEVRIYVTEVSAAAGYTIDNTTQEIYLTFNDNGTIGITQSPYDKGATNTNEPNQGAEINGNVITYQHLNKKRTAEDTYVNLTINKKDLNGAYVNGVYVNITSDTLVDKNNQKLNVIAKTGEQGSDGTITIDYQQFLNNRNNETIRVPGIATESDEMVYDLNISELESTTSGFVVKDGTTVKLRLIFRYKDGIVTLTNVETIYGNRLVENKEFSSASNVTQDSLGIFLSDIILDLYTNYDEVGNLSLDLKKQSVDGQELLGARYSLKITNPDGTVIKKEMDISNGQNSSDIELTGVNVNVGSIIELTEIQAPIGYEINNNTETLEVKSISNTGEITLDHIDKTYNPDRLTLTKNASSVGTSGNMKTNYEINLIDYQLDTFEFGITTKDASSNNTVGGFDFKVQTSQGAQKTITTDNTGYGLSKVGGNIESNTITYTVTNTRAANYYKVLKTPINVNVVFDMSGNIDVDATLKAQTDANYGKTWNISNLQTYGKIDIEMLFTHLDPLVVNVNTVDKITNATITNVNYKITESEELPATGSSTINVGYALENGMKTYNLKQTSLQNSYKQVSDKGFNITYENEKITNATITSSTAEDKIKITGQKQVTITIYVEPKVPFEISNSYFFNTNTKLQGANFEVVSQRNNEKATGTTDVSGITSMYSDILGTDEDVIYKVAQTKAATGYATVEDFYVKVTYNAEREITAAILVDENGNAVTNNRFITVSFKKTSTYSKYNNNKKGIVTIDVLNYPEFKLNIQDNDRRDNTTPIVGTKYSVESSYTNSENTRVNFTKATNVITNSNGLGIASLDKTKDNTIVTYTLKEDNPGIGYQSLGTDINVIVTFDSNGYVSNAVLDNSNSLSKIANISRPTIVNPEDNFVVNIELKNNPLLKFNLTAQDRNDSNVKIKDVGFTIVSKYNDEVYSNSSSTNNANKTSNPQTSYTNVDGKAESYLDRGLDNTDMYYTIKEVKKTPGYEWVDEDIIIKVTYDSDGKIASVAPVQSQANININSYNKENFEINIEVYNDEIKEFGIHLSTVDTYDTDKKLNDMKVEAFLTDQGQNTSYVSDGTYELVGDNSLLTGADRNNDGAPDLSYGEDYKTIGKYTGGAGTRTLRLIVKNDSTKGHYNNTGYYKGTNKYEEAYYQTVQYEYLINVTFDDDGKIQNAHLVTGENQYIGWLANGEYIQVGDGNSISHTDYKLNITMKFFPMFELNVKAMNNYTYQDEINDNGSPLELDGANYTISTLRHKTDTPPEKDEFVTAGYIGYGNYYGNNNRLVYGKTYQDKNELFVPIEKGNTRLFYVFENNEPTEYQEYSRTRQEQIETIDHLVAIIQVAFDENGEIDYSNSVTRRVDNNGNTQIMYPYESESGNTLLTQSNLKTYNYYYDKNEQVKRNIKFYIGYALTTKIKVTAVDDISENTINNIRIYPLINDTEVTNRFYRYEQDDEKYRNTDSTGSQSTKYWGGAVNNNVNTYIIGSAREGSNYNGYLFPSDMASSKLGGSGNAKDYYVKLDVTYGNDGKISSVKSLGADLWGDSNTKEITWDSDTGYINVKMLFSRKFQVQLNKSDYYDSTINNLTASFDITSNKGLKTSINSGKMTPLGKIYKDTTVKYTLSESLVPNGYYPLENTIDYYVTFDKDGNIGKNSVKSGSQYFEMINTSSKTENSVKTSPDLTFSIKNKPAFNLDLQLIDKFYKNEPISDVYLNITNSKGDTASGNPQTDARGYANVVIGPVYPKETVTYYISQTNTAPGYYQNNTQIQLQVKFNDVGKIEEYKIIKGNEVVNNFNETKYQNTRTVTMQIMNMPKDIKIGLYKYDKLTNQGIPGITFTITKTDINSGATSDKQIITEQDGNVIDVVDTFDTSVSGKTIKYTIHEENTPESYRTMEDIAYLIKYNEDGHMESFNQIANSNGILNTKASVQAAVNGNMIKFNSGKVHFKVDIPNDNAFDLIIKNEDTNYAGLGIEGSKFDVSINGNKYEPSLTDANGQTTVNDITETGKLEIKIAQRNVGEGYRDDINNEATIILDKGSQVYSLDLNNSTDGYIDDKNATTTKAIIKVDEEYGKVTVTFKNETKTELTILKQDVNTKQPLQDAQFEVIAQQIDNSGNAIGNSVTLTTNDNNTTNSEGKIYFDLGVAPQSQIWQYTFKEKTPPTGYNAIVDLSMKVTYDQYGRISNLESSKVSRLAAQTEDENYNCHSIYAIIYNGDISPAYTVKVVTEDATTRKRINGSDIYLNITDDKGDIIPVTPKTNASAGNGVTSTTGNLAVDGEKYTDEQIEKMTQEGKAPIILEKGLTYIDNIDYEGTFNIEVSQQKTAEGYIFGNQKTSGNIQISSRYVPVLDADPEVEFTVNDNGNLKVSTDNVNRIITITIYNESQVTFDILTTEYAEQKDTIKVPMQGVNYNITSEIITATNFIPTNLNETTPLSDENGKTTGNVEEAYAGKTVIYTLHQNISQLYQSIDDIRIEVQYDSRGYIKYYELLSSEDNCYINEKETGKRTISINVQNRKNIGTYTVNVEKHAQDTEDDENAYKIRLPDAKFRITVKQEESGVTNTVWEDITDENGEIHGLAFDGFGYITITLEELDSPDGYQIDTTRQLRVFRDKNTGVITPVQSNINFEHNEDYSEIWLKPVDAQEMNKFTLLINKYSTATDKYITTDQAAFNVELIQKDTDGAVTYQDNIGTIYTNKDGRIVLNNQQMPDKAGKYILKINEIKAPEGYVKLTKPIEIPVTFIANSKNEIEIDSVNVDNIDKVTLSRLNKQLIEINIGNDVDEQILEDEYSLDITKVDSETRQGIENMAVFKVWLPDKNNTAVYTETSETLLGPGKLDYCYIEQDKDYSSRLTHMKKPSIDEIKAEENKKITHTYTFQEVSAPDGYALDNTLLTLEIEFGIKINDDGSEEVVITNATTSDGNKLALVNTDEQKVKADILNKEEASSFTVHYDSNTTDTVTNMPNDQIKIADIPLTIDANIPVRDGYTFVEWNTKPDGTGTAFNPSGTYAINANLDLYAQWKISEYTVKYDGNAPIDANTGVAIGLVNGMPADQTKIHDQDLTLDSSIPSIQNQAKYYEFKSWNTMPDGTGTEYNPGDVYNVNASTTLYAQWNYIIHYDGNVPTDSNGFPTGTPRNIPTDEKISIYNDTIIDDLNTYTNVPEMDGYIFKEWNTSPDGTGTVYNPNDQYTLRKGLELYAIWQYEITYEENKPLDDTGFVANVTINNMPASPQIEDINKVANISSDIPTTTPDDYTFKEWNTSPDGTGTTYNPQDVYSGNISIKLYAIWDKNDKLYLKTENYIITDEKYSSYEGDKHQYEIGDKYILGLEARIKGKKVYSEGTTKETLINNIETNATKISITKIDGTELTEDEYIGTGMSLNLEKGREKITITLIVAGDCARNKLNDPNESQLQGGDGIIDVTDIATIKNMSNKNYTNKTIEQILAGDIGYNNEEIDTSDIATIKKLTVRGYKDDAGNEMKGVEYYE